MEEIEKSFFLKMINCGEFAHFSVPGVTLSKRKAPSVSWDMTKIGISRFLSKRKKKSLLKNWAEKGYLDSIFPEDEIKAAKRGIFPYLWDFQYIVPLDLGGKEFLPYNQREDKTEPDRIWEINIRLVHNEANYNLKHWLWFPLQKKMKEVLEEHPRMTHTIFSIPLFPKIVTKEYIDEIFVKNQEAQKKVQTKRKFADDHSRILLIQEENGTVIKIVDHPFVNCRIRRVKVLPAIPNARATFLEDERLQNRVRHRDAWLLAKLNPEERHRMAKTSIYPKRFKFEMHHILPLELGGQNTLDNICLVAPEIHDRFNLAIEKPIMKYLANHPELTFNLEKTPLFIDMPIPLNAYISNQIDLGLVQKSEKDLFITPKERTIKNRRQRHKENKLMERLLRGEFGLEYT